MDMARGLWGGRRVLLGCLGDWKLADTHLVETPALEGMGQGVLVVCVSMNWYDD